MESVTTKSITQSILRTFVYLLVFGFTTIISAQEGTTKAVYQQDMGIAADKDVGYGAETSFLTWHGYLNFEYIAAQGKKNTFDSHEFYLSAKSYISKRVSLTAEFEYEHSPEKLILPIQAYADFKVFDYLTFRAGLFFTPIGIPRTYTLRGNKNRMIRQVALTHDLMFENWAEMGINIFGELPSGIFYDLSIGNGMPNTMGTGDSWFDAVSSLQSHTEDNNDNKAFMGRAGYHSTSFLNGELNTALSYATQKYDPDQTRKMNHIGADIRYLHNSGWRLQAEYMIREGDDNPTDLVKGIAASAYGWYVQVSKRFTFNDNAWIKFIEPVFQIDYIDLNKNLQTNGDKTTYAFGLVYAPEDYYMLKFEYDVVSEKSGVSVDNNVFWASVVMEF